MGMEREILVKSSDYNLQLIVARYVLASFVFKSTKFQIPSTKHGHLNL